MKGLLQTFSSLILALIALLGILFLPETKIKPITDALDYFSKATNTIFDLGSHIISNLVSALFLGLFVYLIIRIAKKNPGDENKVEDDN